ncbi:MAG TPA: intradiol ring-cleavage dioxygenase [Vicinamibacterales bacterium]|nr:intradiol ring-cleavage dioxygenase [Vicinamibacterales bacterium]
MTTTVRAKHTTEEDITSEVLRRFDATKDARLREIMQSLVKHLHAFASEVQLTEREWFAGIEFLTAVGQKCSHNRQEFILLSDTLGLSILTDLINHRIPGSATETTVLGPFYREGAPELPPGGNMAGADATGTPLLISGRVTDPAGRPIAGAVLDCWQANSSGFYDSQLGDGEELGMRGVYRTDADGRYLLRTTRPKYYPIPTDGPVGDMIRATDRHPFRPGHVHYKISAPGYMTLVTHLFDAASKYLDSDTVFAVKPSLVVEFEEHQTPDETARRLGISGTYATGQFDFVLSPTK